MRDIDYKKKYLDLTAQYTRDIDSRDGLLVLIYNDLKMRGDDGIINISDFIWQRLIKVMDEQ